MIFSSLPETHLSRLRPEIWECKINTFIIPNQTFSELFFKFLSFF